MIHIDVKKLGNIPDGGGWRYVGRGQGPVGRTVLGPLARPRTSTTSPRWSAFVHTVIDDYSRVGYAEVHDDETGATAALAPVA